MKFKSITGLFGVLAVLVVGLFAVSILFETSIDQTPAPRKIDMGNFNIKDYSYKVTVEKPEEAVLLFADTETSSDKIGTELTIYNQDLGLVKELRELELKEGLNLVQYKDVASRIDPTSVMFMDLSYPSTFVVEQNYKYDLVSKNKLLEKYLDKEITIEVNENEKTITYTGTLLSYVDGVILQTSEGIIAISNIDKISFPKLPEGLIAKPTLVWKVYTEDSGVRNTQTIYLTGGMSWRADYIAKVNEKDILMDFKGWVTTTNTSGTSYPNSSLKLVAGDIHRVTPTAGVAGGYDYAMKEAAYAPEQFTEEALFEYHMYSLERSTDIMNNETKQISLLASENVPIKKEFVFDASQRTWYYDTSTSNKIKVMLNFKNSEENALGMPLPKGIVRVYKEDSAGKLQFIGEDQIDHTPKDEERRLFLGYAFDVVGERIETLAENVAHCYWRYAYEITIRNHKDEEIEVVVPEHMSRSFRITDHSDPYEKKDSSTIEFRVKVPADGEKKITYTVEYKCYW
ncbi:DUF4139 domain-containing protein [Candidatus Micrarchaeota archaeon]|nr:DUF4139 domain-containing protein [Candidatus Micrarchaeota archaeon]